VAINLLAADAKNLLNALALIMITTTLFHEGKNTLQLKTDEPVALYKNVT